MKWLNDTLYHDLDKMSVFGRVYSPDGYGRTWTAHAWGIGQKTFRGENPRTNRADAVDWLGWQEAEWSIPRMKAETKAQMAWAKKEFEEIMAMIEEAKQQ